MIKVSQFNTLGRAKYDWLDTRHHFSFADYMDPDRMNWGALRVWNDDIIAPGTGFPTHPHADMEIITYVLEGAITHRDSLGSLGRTEAGDVQVMSAGSGIRHSEFNLEDTPTHIFQLWILPSERGGKPAWAAAQFPKADRAGQLVTLASGRPDDSGALRIRQDAAVLGATLTAGQSVKHTLRPGRAAYLVPARGTVTVNGVEVATRSGAAIRNVDEILITAGAEAELLLVDAPELPAR